MRLRRGRLIKRSLGFASVLTGVGSLLSFSSTTVWAGRDFPQRVEVDGPRGSQDGSSAAPSHISTNPVSKVPTNQAQDLSTNEQARLYQRANENLITQTVYIQQNLQSVGDVVNEIGPDKNSSNKDPDTDQQQRIATVTSQYCSADTASTLTGARECLEQYKEMKVAQLRELQQGLVHNDDAQARLRNDLKSAKNKGAGGASNRAPVYGANIKARVFPEIPKYVDMQKDFAARPKVLPDKRFLRSQAEQIAARMLTPPKKEDFVKVSEALIDPNNPQAGTFHQILTGSDGKPLIDMEAFNKAQQTFALMLKAQGSASDSPNAKQDRIKEIADRIMSAQETQELAVRNGNNMNAGVGSDPNLKVPQACGSLSAGPRQDYCYARDLVVRFFNGEDPSQQVSQNKNTLTKAANRTPTAVTQSKGSGTEDYELKASKPSPNGKNETENLYMEPSYIDDVINAQYPK